MVLREEPEEASEARRQLRLETKSKGGTHQNTEGDARQGASQAQAVELPQEETEAFQPEVSADARPLAEPSPERKGWQQASMSVILLWPKKHNCRPELFITQRQNRGFCLGIKELGLIAKNSTLHSRNRFHVCKIH